MNRAYVTFETRAVDEERRTITGWASRPETDRMGDIVEPLGMETPRGTINLLLDHDAKRAVGVVSHLEPRADGVRFTASFPKIKEPGPLQQLVNDAWEMCRSKLRSAVSIGFKPLSSEPLPGGGYRFTGWKILELSLVAVPACEGATIDAIKAYDARARAKAHRVVRLDGSTGSKSRPVVRLGQRRETGLPSGARSVSAAMEAAANDVERALKLAASAKTVGVPEAILLRAQAEGAAATDLALDHLAARIARLEGK